MQRNAGSSVASWIAPPDTRFKSVCALAVPLGPELGFSFGLGSLPVITPVAAAFHILSQNRLLR